MDRACSKQNSCSTSTSRRAPAGPSGRSPPAEHALKLAEAESQGFRDGFEAAEKERVAEAERRTAAAFEQIGDALDRLARGLAAVESRLEAEAVEVAVAVAPQARAGTDRARAVRRDRRARHRLLQAARRRAARRGARQRRAARRPRASGSTRSRAHAASKAAWWCSPSPTSRPATAASNGPTAASPATSAKTEPAIAETVQPLSSPRAAAAASACQNLGRLDA